LNTIDCWNIQIVNIYNIKLNEWFERVIRVFQKERWRNGQVVKGWQKLYSEDDGLVKLDKRREIESSESWIGECWIRSVDDQRSRKCNVCVRKAIVTELEIVLGIWLGLLGIEEDIGIVWGW